MVNPWAPWLAAAVVIAAAAAGWFARDFRTRRGAFVANTSYLSELPSFRARLKAQRRATLAVLLLVALGALAAGLLTGRPVSRTVTDRQMENRDIVLCLDVSGSMLPFNAQVLAVYSEIVNSFEGERISLSIWNFTTHQIFPLTDDYTLVIEQLLLGAQLMGLTAEEYGEDEVLAAEFEAWMAGTFPQTASGSSLIGDGLASCILGFDAQDEERSRTIILATDNEPNGQQVFTLEQAAMLAEERGVRIHGVYASAFPVPERKVEFQEVVTSRGGMFYSLDDPAAVEALVADISAEQASELDGERQVVEADRPEPFYLWLLLPMLGLLVVAWRARI